jgi:hypothetical protein
MALHPVGPLPPSTYWRRRAGLLVGLLVLLVAVRSCTGGESAPAKKPTAATPRPTATATRPAPARVPSPVPSPAPSAAPVVARTCPDPAITLTATTDAGTYPVGATPRITLVVKNTSTTACRRDLGSGAVELLVYSGADRIWSSDDCSAGTASALVTLPPAGTQAVVKTWPARRSAPGCGGTKAAAAPGTYKVVARVGTLRQDGAVFSVHG